MAFITRYCLYCLALLFLIPRYPGYAKDDVRQNSVKNPPPPRKIVFLGDSLTAGYGVEPGQSFPSLIAAALHSEGFKHVEVINAGVSGSTTASGLSRLRWQLKGNPTHLVLALGANDGLRGFDLNKTRDNLKSMIKTALDSQVQVLLAGMKVPPNYGQEYSQKFDAMFLSLSETEGISYYPFLLQGVAGEKKLNLSDGIHPNPEGHQHIAKRIYPLVKEFLRLPPTAETSQKKGAASL